MSCDVVRLLSYLITSHHANLSKMSKHWGSFLTHCNLDRMKGETTLARYMAECVMEMGSVDGNVWILDAKDETDT